jgi:outer membrane biosynthesis protein TonB
MCSFDIGNLFSSKIKDSGYVVFDFVEIGKKSKAPIISETEGKASKTKASNSEDERLNTITKSSMQDVPEAEHHKEPDKQEKQEVNLDKQKKQSDKDEDKKSIALDKPKKPKKSTSKQTEKKQTNPSGPQKKPKKVKSEDKPKKSGSKGHDKAVVNLGKNKSVVDKKSAKKSFDSALDSAIATSDNDNAGIKAEEVGETLTATQVDLIRQKIRKCWHFPSGLKNAEDLVVDIRMELDPDGNVKKAEIVDRNRMLTDSNYKIAAENAYRAVLDPDCNPLPLPKDKYEEWKNLELSFNPKDMFG